MVLRGGLLLSFVAVFLQIAVFLQPLLPKQYQVAPVCETITRALLVSLMFILNILPIIIILISILFPRLHGA